MNSRVVWRKGLSGSVAARRMAPQHRHGGTCGFDGPVYMYDDLPGSLKIKGGEVLHQEYPNGSWQSLCSLAETTAVFDQNGKQLYPADE